MSTRTHVGFDKAPLLASAWVSRPFRGGGRLAEKPGERKGRCYGAVMRWLWAHVKRTCGPAVAMRGRSWIYY
jgi:hypothetical protein